MVAKTIIRQLKTYKEKVAKDFPVKRMLLFGSYAAGRNQKDSDIDLIVVSPSFRKMNFFRRGAKMYGYWHMGYPVDFLCYTPEEFNRLKKQATIVREAIERGIDV